MVLFVLGGEYVGGGGVEDGVVEEVVWGEVLLVFGEDFVCVLFGVWVDFGDGGGLVVLCCWMGEVGWGWGGGYVGGVEGFVVVV